MSFWSDFYSSRRQLKQDYDCRRLGQAFLDPGSIPGISTKILFNLSKNMAIDFLREPQELRTFLAEVGDDQDEIKRRLEMEWYKIQKVIFAITVEMRKDYIALF